MTEQTNPPTIFYDGDCAMCSVLVRCVLAVDRTHLFFYASLNGRTASTRLSAPQLKGEFLVLTEESAVFEAFRAVVRIAWILFPRARILWSFLSIRPVAAMGDVGYAILARIRHHIFPAKRSCALMNAEQARWILP